MESSEPETPGWRGTMKGIGLMIWNPKTKKFLSHDGMEWVKVSLLYAVFYAVLAGFFAIMLAIFMQFVDRRIPTYATDSSLLATKGINPGLGYRPQPVPSENLIKYATSDVTGDNGWGLYHNTLKHYLQGYVVNDTVRELDYIDCEHGTYSDHDLRQRAIERGKACIFDIESFNPVGSPCVAANQYMYPLGQPCVAVKVNRLFNWEPKAYGDGPLPDELRPFWSVAKKDYIYITCNGENPADVDNIHEIEYYSQLQDTRVGGIPFYHYPYRNQEGYHQPFVFIFFKNVAKHVLINIECRAWAKNIDYDRYNMRGSVHIELMID